MVFTLHRYIFRELFKVFVLATVALTLITSLCSMYKPIQEFGVGPGQVVHLLGYFLPITLTFILPMSALFAASLVYGRFASDNELDACRASGVSLMTLVYPGLCLGIMVSITTLVLSFYVVPAFIHRAERMIKANAKQILFRNIHRTGFYTIPNREFMIFADRANDKTDTLEGVIVVQAKGDEVTKLITAEAARVVFSTRANLNEVSVLAKNTYRMDKYNEGRTEELSVSTTFPSLLTDDIKFQRIDDVKRIQADKLNFYPIRELAMRCRGQLAIELLCERISEKLSLGPDSAYEFIGDDRIVLFTAQGCKPGREQAIDLAGPVVLLELDKHLGTLIRRWESNSGSIKLDDEQNGSTVDIILTSPSWDSGDVKGFAREHVIKYLPLPADIEAKLSENNILATIDAVGTDESIIDKPSLEFVRLKSAVQNKIRRTINEISSEVHSRLVFGLGCTALILAGIALGIIFKGGHLLSAFGASSIPAAALIVAIMTGKQLTKNPATPPITGTIVMWVGLAALSFFTFLIYRKLLKT
ncbi:MAG: LptF/LptG family permease [Planctomycetes bacterium]|nr:LptF/LptG family permease [Planctomycetota bacterium]